MVEQFFYEPKQNIFYICDDGHGDYNRSYEQYDRDIDYADYSTDHRDNNFFNIEKKKKKIIKLSECQRGIHFFFDIIIGQNINDIFKIRVYYE